MINSINPSTEELICKFKPDNKELIFKKINRSKIAQIQWQNRKKEERIKILLNVKDNIISRKNDLIDVINEECGFSKEEIEGVIFDILDGFDHYVRVYELKEDINFPINKEVFPESNSNIKFYPLGVIAQIGAWNYPFWQTMITVIPALLTGNTIVYKPSERSTKVGLLISEIINSSKEFPKDIFITIIGSKEEGELLVRSNVDAIVYTGNIDTGEQIIKNAGIKPLILELSGNDAAIICSDCDIEQTVSGVVSGAFLHSGEVCDRIKRVYVLKDIAKEFIDKVVIKTNEIKNFITPLISEELLSNVDNQIKRTISEGAVLLTGGKRFKKKGFYYEPTIIKLKDNKQESVKNEIFGPVLSILVVDSEKEAIKYSNDSKFGLGTSIWTQDFSKVNDIVNQLESGMVWINDSNIPLVAGEYFKGWRSTSIPNASDRLSQFLKSKTIISFNSKNKRDWWF